MLKARLRFMISATRDPSGLISPYSCMPAGDAARFLPLPKAPDGIQVDLASIIAVDVGSFRRAIQVWLVFAEVLNWQRVD